MAAVTKFSFDTAFDATDQFVVPAEEEALPPEPTFSEAELAAAREKGYAEGFEAASDEARASLETATAGALEEIMRQLTNMESVVSEGLQQAQRSAIDLSNAIARKMVDKLNQANAQASVEAVIIDVLGRVLEEPRVVIRVNDALLDPLKQNLSSVTRKSGFPGSIILLTEPGIQIADCRIEWADGGADYSYESLWADIDAIIERHTMAIGSENGDVMDAKDTVDTPEESPEPDAEPTEHIISQEQSNG